MLYVAQSLAFYLPLLIPFLLPITNPFTYMETLLDVTGSVHLGPRLLVNWPPLSQPLPNPSPLQIPRSPDIKRLTMTTSRTRLLLSGTIMLQHRNTGWYILYICSLGEETLKRLLHNMRWESASEMCISMDCSSHYCKNSLLLKLHQLPQT